MTKPILLTLSGGGIRAMAFHTGVLRFLAENNCLERVSKISSVSGGSLIVGLLLQKNGMRWPSSSEYLADTHAKLYEALTSKSLECSMVKELAKPWNWKYAMSRANVLAKAIGRTWGITSSLKELPTSPVWSINGTTAETGKRFRFKGTELRDWEIGTTEDAAFSLQEAMAVSAAFPGLIGPFSLACGRYNWDLPIYGSAENKIAAEKRFKKLHLYDGGVYDNLGLEAFFDAAGKLKPDMDGVLVASDAGAPLPTGFNLGPLNVFRLKHVADIMSDQVRSLRVRGLVAYALKNPGMAAYLRIGAEASQLAAMFGLPPPPGNWMSRSEVNQAASFPTRLMRLTQEEYALLEKSGYESAAMGNYIFKYIA